jgi:hypothetical protein
MMRALAWLLARTSEEVALEEEGRRAGQGSAHSPKGG